MMSRQLATLSLILLVCFALASCNSGDNTAAKPSPSPSSRYAKVAKPEVKTAPPSPKLQPGEEVAILVTDRGTIRIQLFSDIAPKHVEHFKKLINEGFYNGLAFHRAAKNLLIQGGDPNSKSNDRDSWGMGDEKLEKVNAEFSDRPFVKGSLGAARGFDPNGASTQFFICAGPYPSWTGQYTNYGQVIAGQEVVQAIASAPTDNQDRLKTKVVLKKVYLEKSK